PFYVTVGYDTDYLRSQYIGFFYVLGLCWFVLTAAMIAAAGFIRSLEKMNQRIELEAVNSAIAERQNLSADMHDSIGASLATLLAHFTTDNIDPVAVKRRIAEILMELRFLVDSAEPVDGELNLILSNVRHRMGSGLELAGIDLNWQASELPRIAGLKARDALSIKLIMMEALSNILHHSKAKSASLTAAFIAPTSTVVIAIKDDGCGFNAADAASAGRGIFNMRKRIRAISTGGTIAIESSPGQGTTIRIELRVPPAAEP
ncbi:MAG TPA: ATP-binding protein, partial [Pseudolabrys sp.]